jgi:hypothetical protein
MRRNSKQKTITFLSIFFLGILLVTTILFGIKSASQGVILMELEDKAHLFETANDELSNVLVTNTSLAKIGERANEMGMIKAEKTVYLKADAPVANLPR